MPSVDDYRSRFASMHVKVPDEWIRQCITRLREENSTLRVLDFDVIYKKWLNSDLKLLKSSCLPLNLNYSALQKQALKGNFALQINSLMDVSQPCYSQLQTIRGDDMTNSTVSAEAPKAERWEPKATRMLFLNMTDGVRDIKGMEYEPISCLNAGLPPGTKILLFGDLELRKGTILLKRNNVKVLGGKVEELEIANSKKSLLISKLGLIADDDTILQGTGTMAAGSNSANTEEQYDVFDDFPSDDFPDDLLDEEARLLEEEHYQLGNTTELTSSITRSNNEQASSSATNSSYHNQVESARIVSVVTSPSVSVNTSVGFNWPCTSVDKSRKFPLFSSHSPTKTLFTTTNPVNTNHFSRKQKSKPNLNRLSKLSLNSREIASSSTASGTASSSSARDQNDVTTTVSSTVTNQFDKVNNVSVENSNDGMWEDCNDLLFANLKEDNLTDTDFVDLTDDNDFEIEVTTSCVSNNENASSISTTKFASTAPTTVTQSVSRANEKNHQDNHKCGPNQVQPKLPALTKSPYTYICEILNNDCQMFKKYTIRGFFFTLLGNVKSRANTGWVLDALVNDGTGSLKVQLSNKLLEELLGFSHEAKAEAKKNPEVHKALLQGVENCCEKLRNFSGLMDIEVTPESLPQVIKLASITEDVVDKLFGDVCGMLN